CYFGLTHNLVERRRRQWYLLQQLLGRRFTQHALLGGGLAGRDVLEARARNESYDGAAGGDARRSISTFGKSRGSTAAPKGASDFEESAVSLERYPDTSLPCTKPR